MSKYLPTIKYSTEFEGDAIEVELLRLSRKDYMDIITNSAAEIGEGGAAKVDVVKVVNNLNNFSDKLVDHVKVFKGLKDADGNALNFKDIVNTTYFTELVMDVMKELIEKSGRLREDEEKKSELPSV